MKVLFVLPNMNAGGVGRISLTLIEYLTQQGIECRLVLRQCRGELMERARKLVPIDEIAPNSLHQFVPGLVKVIKREQPTHIVSAFSDIGVLCWLALRWARSKAKWVHSVHDSHGKKDSWPGSWGQARYWLYNRMAGFVYRRADAIVTVSNGVRQEVVDDYGIDSDRVTTIYNPAIPDAELQNKPLRHSGFSDPVQILAMGRLERQKGFDLLIPAMAQVPGRWQLDIWGEGPERTTLAAHIAKHGLQDKVHLRGYTAEPFEVMRNADIYVMSSRHEGLGNTLIEALACGCQVVSTDCPQGPSEVLDNGRYGQLVPSTDIKELTHAIVLCMNGDFMVNPKILIRRAQDFTVQSSALQWQSLLTDL